MSARTASSIWARSSISPPEESAADYPRPPVDDARYVLGELGGYAHLRRDYAAHALEIELLEGRVREGIDPAAGG